MDNNYMNEKQKVLMFSLYFSRKSCNATVLKGMMARHQAVKQFGDIKKNRPTVETIIIQLFIVFYRIFQVPEICL